MLPKIGISYLELLILITTALSDCQSSFEVVEFESITF